MTSAAPLTEYVQTSLPLAFHPDDNQPTATAATAAKPWNNAPSTGMALPTPRMIKSVVDEAGLGKFVYLQGSSGRRYVFSSIRREQAALYDHALFATAYTGTFGNQSVRIASTLQEVSDSGGSIYVHLLDETDNLGSQTLQDLCGGDFIA